MYSTPPSPQEKNDFLWWRWGGGWVVWSQAAVTTIGWWDIVLEWTTFGEHNSPYPSPFPSIESWGVCCFLQVARTAAQHCMEGSGGGGKESFIFPFFKLAKRQRGPLGRSVSTNFVANCGETNLPQHAQGTRYWFLLHFKNVFKTSVQN